MKTKILKLTDTFDGKFVKVQVRKPELLELVKYQNNAMAAKTDEERIEAALDAVLELIIKPVGGLEETENWKELLRKDFDNALVVLGLKMFRDGKVEDVEGDEPNFTES